MDVVHGAGSRAPRRNCSHKMRKAFATYMESRRHTVAVKTYRSDMEMVKLMPPNLGNLHVGRVTDREVQRVLDAWSRLRGIVGEEVPGRALGILRVERP